MRLQPETVLVVCLCLWIPVAPSYGVLASEDQDGSGSGDEFSGSGSGDDDDDNWIFEARPPTQASPINTTMPWSTDVPTNPPKRPVTLKIVTETPSHLTEAPLPHTTQITETEPTEDIIPFSSGDVPKAKTTTFSTVAQPETTVPPAVKLPALPEPADEYTTEATDEKGPTESSVLEPEETTVDDAPAMATEAPDMETTPVLLHATPDSNSADADASGDSVESTTAQDEGVHFIETNIIPEEHAPKIGDPRTNDNDFDFNNEIRKPRLNSEPPGSESDFARGSASDNDSLLERKEVLAGVIAGGVVGLAFAIMLISLMVYRMKKKDEGSYSLDEHKHPNGGYQKAQKQEEFLA